MQVVTALLIDEVQKHADGRVDLLGLFEDLYLDEVPVTLEAISLFVDLAISEPDRGIAHTLEFRLLDPNGIAKQDPTRIRFTVPYENEFPRDSAQLDLALFNLTFHEYGKYAIEIRIGHELLRRIPLYVNSKDNLGAVPGAQSEFDSTVER